MTTAAILDTTDMVLVHRVFRRELGMLPALLRHTDEPTAVARVVDHATELLQMLHHHHSGEDDLVWPKLLERVTPEAALVARMQSQHEVVGGLIADIESALPGWGGDAGRGEALADLCEQLVVALVEHLDEEERSILPLVAQTFTQAEWDEIGRRGFAATPKNRRLVTLGHILEEATEQERAAFLAHLPAPARIAWRLVGRKQFAKETAAIRVPAQRQGQ